MNKSNNYFKRCLACNLVNNQGIVVKKSIIVTKNFDAHQDCMVPLPGFIIIAARRHIKKLTEMTSPERIELIKLISRIRQGMENTLKIKNITIIQEEDTPHHFHLWLFPRYGWMDKKFGKKIDSILPIIKFVMKNFQTQKHINQVDLTIKKISAYLNKYY